MAKNREPVKAVSGSSEEETDSSSSDEQVAQPTITATSSKTPLPESSAESGEESSESEQEEAQPTIATTKKPIPESEESGEEESESEDEEETTVVNSKLTPAKRSLPVPQEKEILKTPDTKKAKKNEPIEKVKKSAAAVSESSKKNLFQRIWSEEDEIVILKGLLEYPGEVNNANVDAFLDSIKEALHSSEVNKVQLLDKVRRLKKKFKNNMAKKVRNFAKPHEKEAYDLSLEIWGNSDSDTVVAAANGNAKSVKGKGKSKGKSVKANKSADSEAGAVEVASGYGEGKAKIAAGFKFGAFGSNVEKLLSIGADMFEGEEGVKGSKEWKKLEREEMELVHKHTKVILAKTNLVLDNLK